MSGIKLFAAAAIVMFGLAGTAPAADAPVTTFNAGRQMDGRTSLSSFRSAARPADGSFGVRRQDFKGGDLFAGSTLSTSALVSKDVSTLTISGGKAALDSTQGFKASE